MTFEYNKICRLCLNSSNTYLMNVFNSEYQIVEMIAELITLEVFQHDPYPKVICTDCYSNLVIFNEFKKICRNADDLLRKYQINKTDSQEVDSAGTSNNTKGNGKCKSIRNSDDMAQRIRETAYKKSITFVENMKSFYFLLNQIEDLENGGGQVIIKNEISTESLIPAVELNIKNEIIYPSEENHQMMMQHGVIQQNPESSGESKRKKRKNNKRKSVNGQTMEIDETGNIVATRQIVITTDPQHHHQQQQQQQQQLHHQHQNIQISTQNNNEMALMLTVKSIDQEHAQVVATSTGHSQTIQPTQIQIHSNHPLPSLTAHHSSSGSSTVTSSAPQTITTILQYSCSSCHEIFNTTDSLRQHLFHNHQILFPFSTTTATTSGEHQQYQQVTIPQTNLAQIVSTTIQPSTSQQFTTFTHKKYFESEFPCMLCGVVSKNQDDLIKHMIQHTTTTTSQPIQTIQKVTTIVERDRNVVPTTTIDMSPTDLSSSTSQYK